MIILKGYVSSYSCESFEKGSTSGYVHRFRVCENGVAFYVSGFTKDREPVFSSVNGFISIEDGMYVELPVRIETYIASDKSTGENISRYSLRALS